MARRYGPAQVIVKIPDDLAQQLAGHGLQVNADGKLELKVGPGFTLEKVERSAVTSDTHSLIADPTPDPFLTLTWSALTDVVLTLNGPELTLTKSLTQYRLERNAAGIPLDITRESTTSSETLTLPIGGYGYGYGYGYSGYSVTPARLSTPKFPNFYKL